MILGIDTTSDWSSIALGDECVVWDGNRSQSRELLPKIQDLMKKNKSSFDDLSGVVVVNGPGSYTGIRIGVSVANTIGMLKGILVKGVDALEAQVKSKREKVKSNNAISKKQEERSKIKEKYENVVSLISAGGTRVYACKYQIPNLKSQKEQEKYFVGEVNEYLGGIDKKICIVGEVNGEVENWIKSSGFEKFELLNQDDKLGRAWGAVQMWNELPEVKNDNVIPLYLRGAVKQEVRSKK